ncbi:hypothetical protein P153DRAFT_367594 [Dothidotthia symphoricarpi CBS 119687]|uniref:Uncharacterized protein n=1 Tax=Dothidotthia symphoricarpi CBS 119687 TaxID=1392245 RepID=A0A6A6AC65_9PLEO|nr:uncharacterized protein P153DRAFT_367594 [Dothidotthia symphoricarpi CBS 119687]KAF2128457.1 hypothetical protein P153DRAFT_367594 [Dothidotthia symphoricarpi CBS 119687]
MSAFAPPVRRDNFLFSSILYADAGNDNHHPRASVTELTALLRPEAPKPNNKKSKAAEPAEPPRDPPWHFWTAQLLHYGQTSTKDKNAAKVRLLSSLNGARLEVPGWIVRLEAELKKEWEAENRKLKKTTKQHAIPGPVSTPVTDKKEVKKKEPKTSATPVAVSKTVIENKGPSRSAIKAVPASAPKSVQGKRKLDDHARSEESNKKAKLKSKAHPKVSPELTSNGTPTNIPIAETSASQGDEPWPAPNRIIIPYIGAYFLDRDPYADTRPSNAPRPGAYRVSCPDIEAQWSGTSIDEFYLAFSASENEWWSRFRWGNFQGMMILDRIPKKANKTVGVPFKWRAHYAPENEDGEGTGKIFFTSTKEFKGEFHSLFEERPCFFRAERLDTARSQCNGPLRKPFGTPVLDQMRIEWGQMSAVMKDAPAKKPRTKKERPSDSKPTTKKSTLPAGSEQEDEQMDVYLSGTYKIDSPTLCSTFPSFDPNSFRLTLITDEQRGIWWAKFVWGSLSGIIQLNPGPTYDTLDESHSLGWRIKDLNNGEMRFGKNCTGKMKFFGHERALEGCLFEVPHIGTVEFWGERIPGPRRVKGLQDEWDAFVREAYGR